MNAGGEETANDGGITATVSISSTAGQTHGCDRPIDLVRSLGLLLEVAVALAVAPRRVFVEPDQIRRFALRDTAEDAHALLHVERPRSIQRMRDSFRGHGSTF